MKLDWRWAEPSVELIYVQKQNYIWNNPVKDGFVYRVEDWKYSSAGWENPLAGQLSKQ